VRVSELADAARLRGLTVVEVAGWRERGNEFPVRPDGALRHWTAGAATGDTPSLGVVTHGRSDLAGPLCNLYQSRRVDANGLDVVYAVAAGKANHAGDGLWNGIRGNYRLLGLEIEWSGPAEAFAGVRRRKLTSELAMRALLDCCSGTNPDDAAEHREYALPAGRKIDTNLDGGELRRRMAELAGPPPDREEDMALIVRGDQSAYWWITDGLHKDLIESAEVGAALVYHGLAKWNDAAKEAVVVGQAWLDSIPRVAVSGPTAAEISGLVVDAVLAALPPASAGGLSKADAQEAAKAAIVEQFGPIFDLPGD
jgi:hypothetical protein